jgi:hypothetical protein
MTVQDRTVPRPSDRGEHEPGIGAVAVGADHVGRVAERPQREQRATVSTWVGRGLPEGSRLLVGYGNGADQRGALKGSPGSPSLSRVISSQS